MPDGTLGALQLAPWQYWDQLAFGDGAAALLSTAGSALCLVSLYLHKAGDPVAYTTVTSGVATCFFLGQMAMFIDRERHGAARLLHILPSIALALASTMWIHQVGGARLIASAWIPAGLGLLTGIVLHRQRGLRPAQTPARALA